jgi:hypothetical protein
MIKEKVLYRTLVSMRKSTNPWPNPIGESMAAEKTRFFGPKSRLFGVRTKNRLFWCNGNYKNNVRGSKISSLKRYTKPTLNLINLNTQSLLKTKIFEL